MNTSSTWAAFPTVNKSWRQSLSSRRQAGFFSPLNPQDLSSRQRTVDWTGQGHEPRKAIAQIMIVFIFSIYDELKTLRRAQDANSVFHQRCSDAVILYDNMLAKRQCATHSLHFRRHVSLYAVFLVMLVDSSDASKTASFQWKHQERVLPACDTNTVQAIGGLHATNVTSR